MADQFYGLTDTGKERTNNEDTFIAQLGANDRFIVACVIDGVGGYSGGEVAAELAREAILKRLSKPSGEVIPMMIDCFNRANQQILDGKKQVKEHDSMACVATLALVDLEHNQFYYTHVGDTRLYLLRDETLVKISHDQSFVGFLEESGRLTEDAAMTHPKRNEINKALGFEASLAKDSDYIETGQSPFLPGDTILLCSDGLTDMVNKADITDILTTKASLKDKCRLLIEAANYKGGKDNITVVLVQNSKQPLKHDATMPAAGSKKDGPMGEPYKEERSAPVVKEHKPDQITPGNTGTIIFLTVLMLLFLGGNIWQYLKAHPAKTPQKPADSIVVKGPNKQELKLQNAITQAKGKVLILADTAYTSPILISKAIEIANDSLWIKAKGKIELQSDSGYTGPAFNIAAKSKSITLDSLTISNFKIGVQCYQWSLGLKNTRFVNCATPVLMASNIPNKKYITGNGLVFRVDSVPVTIKHK